MSMVLVVRKKKSVRAQKLNAKFRAAESSFPLPTPGVCYKCNMGDEKNITSELPLYYVVNI